MPCSTTVLINLPDDRWNTEARKKLGLSLTGGLSQRDATRVRVEAGKLKTISAAKALNPTAMIRSDGNKLSISINI